MLANNWQNDTLSSITFNITTMMPDIVTKAPKRHVTFASQLVLTLVYITGVIGNVSALIILLHKDKRRNRKHLLMLRCLATNDLMALLGMLVQIGCVAIVMAAERWLALTRPFVYQKQVTYPVIVRCMLALWLVALGMTSLPVMGFGLYYKNERCVRYREAIEPADVAYAYVWFILGTLLCLSIVWCNLAVFRALSKLSHRASALGRISKASSRIKPLLTIAAPNRSEVVATTEERAFARLMAVLSISFVICWMPHMLSIPLAQVAMQLPPTAVITRKCIRIFYIIADILLCVHFTLDPYIYVLLRIPRPRFQLLKPLCKICWPDRSRSNSFTGTTDHQCSSGGPPTPITEAPSTPVSEVHNSHLIGGSL
nr:PREDICTED: prostaglandin E2 receptor EP2 subtype isoform X3 [Linepithema humile]